MIWILILAIILIIIGIIFFFFIKRQKGSLGSLGGKVTYQDSNATPGDVLYGKTLNLVGKPDYIVHSKDGIIPIEVKTGKTPTYPYESHIMQLMAYCLLVEENFNTRPAGGIIRYHATSTEFKIAYTKEAEQAVRNVVAEITRMKATGEEPTCNHPEHNQ